MRLWLMLVISCLCPFAFGAPGDLPETTRRLCVLVQSEVGDGGCGVSGTATGTGLFVAPDLVLTCNHLLLIPFDYGTVPADRVSVETRRGNFVPATIVRRDLEHDLALLKVSETVAVQPMKIPKFRLKRGGKVMIVANFPDAIRVVRGELVNRTLMEGFAVSSAKVRSGFSGGPIIDPEGAVQGILSQRDNANNSIFVRSDVIRNMLMDYSRETGRELSCLEEPAPATATLVSTGVADTEPARDSVEIVVALPVRRATAAYCR